MSDATVRAEELLRHAGWIRRLAARLVGEDDADDLVQETWTAALDRGETRPGWLAAVARNLALLRGRGGANRRARERGRGADEALPSAEELAARAETARRLVEHVLALEEPLREALLLRFYEGLEPSEIARRRGEPAGTVRSRLARATARLREQLDREHGGRRQSWTGALTPLLATDGTPAAASTAASLTALSGALMTKSFALAALAACLALCVGLGMRVGRDADLPAAAGGDVAASVAAAPAGAAAPRAAGASRESEAPELRADASPAERERAADAAPGEAAEAEPPAAPLRGVVVDEVTGAPVPFYRFAVARGDERVEVETDGAGAFATDRAFAAGDLTLDLAAQRHPRDLIQGAGREAFREFAWTRRHAHDPLGGPEELGELGELALPVGPTIRLRVTGPDAAALDALDVELRAADARFAFDHLHAEPVRESASTWRARFSPVARLTAGGPPYRVTATTPDGLWTGSAEVDAVVGERAAPLEIALSARGAVRGTVLLADGSPLVRSWVQLHGVGATFESGDPDERPRFALTDAEGAYLARAVPPGEYAVRVSADGHADHAGTVRVAAGAIVHHDVRLAPRAPMARGIVRGVVHSRTGGFRGPLAIGVRASDDDAARTVRVRWTEEDGEMVGRFELERLPAVPHVVTFEPAGLLAVSPRALEVVPEPGGVEVAGVVADDVALADLRVRAVDARTGAAVAAFDAWLTVAPDTPDARTRHAEATGGAGATASFAGVPQGEPWELRVLAREHANAWLASSAAERGAGAVTIALQRGWSTRVRCVDPGGAPLAGVDVLCDGAHVGRTGADGRLLVELPAAPETLHVAFEDWEVVGDAGYDAKTGRFRSHEWWVRIALRPPG
jgi:RNA polymerase sigma-70 factor (ECF subfamily)